MTTPTATGWDLGSGLDPATVDALITEQRRRTDAEIAQSHRDQEAARAQARIDAEPRVRAFQAQVAALGLTPEDNPCTVYDNQVRIAQHLVTIPAHTTHLDTRDPARKLVLALGEDDIVHIRVHQDPRDYPVRPAYGYDAGPVWTRDDLARVLTYPGNSWTPPSPAPVEGTEPEPTAAERARTLLDGLHADPINHTGQRGLQLATGYALLAHTETPRST